MNKFLRHPATNAVGLCVFSAFYAVMFLGFSDKITGAAGNAVGTFWRGWESFLIAGGHRITAVVLIVITLAVLALLLIKHKPYDEYHTAILIKCLSVSVILTLLAIGVFFFLVLLDPTAFLSKFMLFTTINWSTVILADLVYLLLCRRK